RDTNRRKCMHVGATWQWCKLEESALVQRYLKTFSPIIYRVYTAKWPHYRGLIVVDVAAVPEIPGDNHQLVVLVVANHPVISNPVALEPGLICCHTSAPVSGVLQCCYFVHIFADAPQHGLIEFA